MTLAGEILLAGVLLYGLFKIMNFTGAKSYTYRKHLVNLLIAGKVRQKAEEERVSLEEEQAAFDNFNVSAKTRRQLDEQIEENLTEDIEEEYSAVEKDLLKDKKK